VVCLLACWPGCNKADMQQDRAVFRQGRYRSCGCSLMGVLETEWKSPRHSYTGNSLPVLFLFCCRTWLL